MQNLGYCNLNLIPVRSNPGHREEMVNQLIFGDLYEIKEEKEGWVLISTLHDNYQGWIQQEQLCRKIGEAEDTDNSVSLVLEQVAYVYPATKPKRRIPVVYGTLITGIKDRKFQIGEDKYLFEGRLAMITKANEGQELVDVAMMYYGSPYQWGGRSPFGIDCSGLTQMAFRVKGINLPRDARQQAQLGKTVPIADSKPGDLAFFGDEPEKITHVGFVLEFQRILHASGRVRFDWLNEEGIVNDETNVLTHKLQIIKRIL